MNRNPRAARIPALLGLLAMLAQLLLPAAHAQEMARRASDPVQLALCGGSPALIAELRRSAPPELLRQLEAQGGSTASTSCDHTSIASTPFALPSQAPALPDVSAWRHVLVARKGSTAESIPRTHPPQARAPPSLSRFEIHALTS